MKKNATESIERQELINKLMASGYEELVEVLLMTESYTKRGRLNKSGACRLLKWKPKQLEDAINKCREILKDDLTL